MSGKTSMRGGLVGEQFLLRGCNHLLGQRAGRISGFNNRKLSAVRSARRVDWRLQQQFQSLRHHILERTPLQRGARLRLAKKRIRQVNGRSQEGILAYLCFSGYRFWFGGYPGYRALNATVCKVFGKSTCIFQLMINNTFVRPFKSNSKTIRPHILKTHQNFNLPP